MSPPLGTRPDGCLAIVAQEPGCYHGPEKARDLPKADPACVDASEAFPHPDGGFGLAANAFGLWHLADAGAGLREACRILRPVGHFACTTWLTPEEGFDLFGIIVAAIRRHGTLDLPLPPAPPPSETKELVKAALVARAEAFSGDLIELRFPTFSSPPPRRSLCPPSGSRTRSRV